MNKEKAKLLIKELSDLFKDDSAQLESLKNAAVSIQLYDLAAEIKQRQKKLAEIKADKDFNIFESGQSLDERAIELLAKLMSGELSDDEKSKVGGVVFINNGIDSKYHTLLLNTNTFNGIGLLEQAKYLLCKTLE